jgi:hypothetical protein
MEVSIEIDIDIDLKEYVTEENDKYSFIEDKTVRKQTKEQEEVRKVLMDYGNKEYGDCIIDDICEVFGHPLTPNE